MRRLFSKNSVRWAIVSALILLGLIETQRYPHSGLVQRIESFLSDERLKVWPAAPDRNVVIVDIDEKSLAALGHYPWSRHILANLITQLTDKYNVKTVGFDIMFSEPDTSSGYATIDALAKKEFNDVPQFRARIEALRPELDYDARLAKAIHGKPIVLGFFLSDPPSIGVPPTPAFSITDLDGRALLTMERLSYQGNLPTLQKAAVAGGFFNADVDEDGQIRSSPLLAKIGDHYYESLALATARVALGGTRIRPDFPKVTVLESQEAARDYGAAENIVIETDTPPYKKKFAVGDGVRMNIYYRGPGGPRGGGFNYVSAVDVIRGKVAPEVLAQKIVLIGTTAIGLNDLRATPVSASFPGVEVHANMIASIFDGKIKLKPGYDIAVDLVQIILLGVILGGVLPRLKPVASIFFSFAIAAGVGAFNFWMYQSFNQILPLATALLLILGLFIVNVAWGYWFEYRNGRAMVNLFGEYVSPDLVAKMADNPHRYSMEGENRELTVLFVDVRGFTTISEGLPTKQLREYINIYLTAMSEDIRGNRGTLDKYIGDAVMAFWGAPVPLPDHAARAVESAMKMQISAHKLNQEFIMRGWPALKIGIGLNTGQMQVGDMGSKIRRAYTVMGDAVNLGARLEGITKEYGVGIVVGELTKLAAPEFVYRELDRVRVKGKNEPVPIFEPIAKQVELDDSMRAALALWHTALSLVRSMEWDQAQSIIAQLHGQYPDDYLYQLYLERIAQYRTNPPEADWDGVTNYKTK